MLQMRFVWCIAIAGSLRAHDPHDHAIGGGLWPYSGVSGVPPVNTLRSGRMPAYPGVLGACSLVKPGIGSGYRGGVQGGVRPAAPPGAAGVSGGPGGLGGLVQTVGSVGMGRVCVCVCRLHARRSVCRSRCSRDRRLKPIDASNRSNSPPVDRVDRPCSPLPPHRFDLTTTPNAPARITVHPIMLLRDVLATRPVGCGAWGRNPGKKQPRSGGLGRFEGGRTIRRTVPWIVSTPPWAEGTAYEHPLSSDPLECHGGVRR